MLDQVDIPFLRALRAEWRVAPPLRSMVAAFAGHKPPVEARTPQARSAPGPAAGIGQIDARGLKTALGL